MTPMTETNPLWRATVLTLYPEMFPGPLGQSLAGRGLDEGIWALEAVNIRDFADDAHASVDDTPAGGGPGMVMRADVLTEAVESVAAMGPLLLMTPRGNPLDQKRVRELAAAGAARIVCGRFEGVDERFLEETGAEEISIGDYVLSGGEPAALALMDAVVRLLPGILGEAESLSEESFNDGLLEYPQYTRPREWRGRSIPDVLLSGHHAEIAAWRQAKREELTSERRPDLWAQHRPKQRKLTKEV